MRYCTTAQKLIPPSFSRQHFPTLTGNVLLLLYYKNLFEIFPIGLTLQIMNGATTWSSRSQETHGWLLPHRNPVPALAGKQWGALTLNRR